MPDSAAFATLAQAFRVAGSSVGRPGRSRPLACESSERLTRRAELLTLGDLDVGIWRLGRSGRQHLLRNRQLAVWNIRRRQRRSGKRRQGQFGSHPTAEYLYAVGRQSTRQRRYRLWSRRRVLVAHANTSATPLAAAAGKQGTMFVMNQNSLGGHSTNYNNVLAQHPSVDAGAVSHTSALEATRSSHRRQRRQLRDGLESQRLARSVKVELGGTFDRPAQRARSRVSSPPFRRTEAIRARSFGP